MLVLGVVLGIALGIGFLAASMAAAKKMGTDNFLTVVGSLAGVIGTLFLMSRVPEFLFIKENYCVLGYLDFKHYFSLAGIALLAYFVFLFPFNTNSKIKSFLKEVGGETQKKEKLCPIYKQCMNRRCENIDGSQSGKGYNCDARTDAIEAIAREEEEKKRKKQEKAAKKK